MNFPWTPNRSSYTVQEICGALCESNQQRVYHLSFLLETKYSWNHPHKARDPHPTHSDIVNHIMGHLNWSYHIAIYVSIFSFIFQILKEKHFSIILLAFENLVYQECSLAFSGGSGMGVPPLKIWKTYGMIV